MQALRKCAFTSVARACGFAMLAVMMLMTGLAGFPVIALKTGAIAFMLTAAILAIKAERATHKPYQRTELWQLLLPHERPRKDIAQRVVSAVLRDTFIRFAWNFATLGAVAFLVAIGLQLFRD
jgi:hypothetical protein